MRKAIRRQTFGVFEICREPRIKEQYRRTAASKVFIEFLALIIRNRMYNYRKDAVKEMDSKLNYMMVPTAIRELDKIEMARQLDGVYRLDHAVIATQKKILKAFGITADYV
ncbi:MAG: hypothetical protein LUH07_05450 [Lachnospiraceae bacterium]|nr:hypothetical protein [Lachnospiraceae bacterium]